MADDAITRMILTVRLVLLAIAAGIIVLGVVAGVLVTGGNIPAQPKLGSLLLPALLVVAAMMVVVFLLVRQLMLAGLRRGEPGDRAGEVPAQKLLGRFQALTIVGGTLVELPALFGVVVFLLTRQWVALLVPALGLGSLILLFPSRDKFTRFADGINGSREV